MSVIYKPINASHDPLLPAIASCRQKAPARSHLQAVLGEGPTSCVLLEHHGTRILLDCAAAPFLSSIRCTGSAGDAGSAVQSPACELRLRLPRLDPLVDGRLALQAILVTSPAGLLGLPRLAAALAAAGRRLPLHVYCTRACHAAFANTARELLDAAQQLASVDETAAAHSLAAPQQQRTSPSPQMRLLSLQLAATTAQAWASSAGLQQPLHQQYGFWGRTGTAVPAAAPPSVPPPRPPPGCPLPVPPRPPPQQQGSSGGGISSSSSKTATCPNGNSRGATDDRGGSGDGSGDDAPFFSLLELECILAQLQPVSFGQRVQLPGSLGLVAEARPCGSGLGSAMWTLSLGNQRCGGSLQLVMLICLQQWAAQHSACMLWLPHGRAAARPAPAEMTGQRERETHHASL